MPQLFEIWRKVALESAKGEETISKFLMDTNEKFKTVLNNCSWAIYIGTAFVAVFCLYFLFHDYKRRMDMRRRRQDVQRANDRQPQRRRPGAATREHEIFRNVIKTVRTYSDKNDIKPAVESYILRRTRSGAVYGSFPDRASSDG